MANTLGIPEVTLAEAADSTNAVNLRANKSYLASKVIRITDHVSNDAGEVGADTEKMALFHQRGLGHPWQRQGTHKAIKHHVTVDPVLDVIPTDVEWLFPDFDYSTFE